MYITVLRIFTKVYLNNMPDDKRNICFEHYCRFYHKFGGCTAIINIPNGINLIIIFFSVITQVYTIFHVCIFSLNYFHLYYIRTFIFLH
jgi:hypothetical protein